MKGNTIATGICGLLLLAPAAFADPLVTSAEKAYRLLQTTTSQLEKTQKALGPQSPAPAVTALAKAEEQVHIAFAHCCRALYAAHLQAAKQALTEHDQQRALRHLSEADKVLGKCAAPLPGEEPDSTSEALALGDAFEQR